MIKSYSDHIKTGELSQIDAIKNQSVREAARHAMSMTLAAHVKQELPADAAAFGVLDLIAVKMVEWYGPEAARDVFNHYAEVCGRQPVKTAEGGDA